MDLFVLWTRCAATAKGTVQKLVTCEACGAEYSYALERETLGHGLSLYAFDLESAQRRAQERARTRLAKRLARDHDVVPCPKCGWIQANMMRIEKRDHARWMDTAGWFIVSLAVAAACLNAAMGTGAPHRRVLLPWPAVLTIAALGAVLVAVRHGLAAAYDPNTEPLETRLARARERATERDGGVEPPSTPA